ncbi:glycosyltransferase [Aliarcobacter butzleri]|uniref:glycosyltransferase n=1 Tax=Aliarcobacter butzleri TaxID=28197 RepID=UPI00125F76F7|nr:glycosyltransferase [Aliarcobacter butzleri]MDK2064382.1 glycosyltransferase [Aliarcobacter butzleri]
MKKVTSIVLNNFKNDSRVLKENISLQKVGYEVKVVALHEEPLKEYDEVQNIPVHRVRLKSRGWSKNKVIQILKYAEFIYKVIKQYKNSSIIHCNDLNTLPIGVIIKKFFNKDTKIVYDAHEYEINDTPNESKYKIKIKYILEKFLIKYVDKVMTVSDSIADEYVRLYNIKKPALVLNTPPYKNIEKKNIFRENLGIKENQTIFLYQGGLSRGRGIEILLETFKTIDDENAVIVFMGYGSLENLIRETSKEYKNIYFHQAVSPDVLLDYTSSADFGISTIEDSCLSYRYCLPNKMFEYLMAEIPVIVSNLYEMRRLVETNRIGIVAEENTPKGLKDGIEKSMKLDKKELKCNIQKVKTIYNWEEQEKVLLNVYKGLI